MSEGEVGEQGEDGWVALSGSTAPETPISHHFYITLNKRGAHDHIGAQQLQHICGNT